MSEPGLRREGNLRLASIACDGLPADAWAVYARCMSLVETRSDLTPNGPLVILFDLAPLDDEPASWRCQVGTAVTGFAAAEPPLLIEDYHNLQALSLPHTTPLKQLRATWQNLRDHAGTMSWRLRPYWRLTLERTQTPDGNLLPRCELSVFLDR